MVFCLNLNLSEAFVARVWHNWHGKPQLCIEWHVELAALDYLGSKVQAPANLFNILHLLFNSHSMTVVHE